MISGSNSSHISAAFSIVDILSVLYFKIMKIKPAKPAWKQRDRFILSKGHAGAAVYSALARRGFFPVSRLWSFARNNSGFAAHVFRTAGPGIEMTAGSLGHGLGVGLGMALALKQEKSAARVFVLVGDGECNEGSIWEAALVAKQHKLDNLIAIIDYNKQQSMGASKKIIDLEPLALKWKSFGWEVVEAGGHDAAKLIKVFKSLGKRRGKPKVLIAHTIKGKGVSYMERDPLSWHYKIPKGDFLLQAEKELGL